MYQFTSLESYVQKLLTSIGITEPEQLKLENLASALDIELSYWSRKSEALNFGVEKHIFLDGRIDRKVQNQKFGHELCHILMHYGKQYGMPELFREYQEWKAESFALQFCVPTFMLLEMGLPYDIKKAVHLIERTFNVTTEFAVKRLKYHENKLLAAEENRIFQQKCTQQNKPYELWYR